jgi:hypothetical protein
MTFLKVPGPREITSYKLKDYKIDFLKRVSLLAGRQGRGAF